MWQWLIFPTADNISQRQGSGTNNTTTCCLQGPHIKSFGKDQRQTCPCLLLFTPQVWQTFGFLFQRLLPSVFYSCFKEEFLEGHTTTQAYTKINCLYRNLWVDVWVPGRTTVYLRIHLELLTLNHSRAADFSVVVSVSKWALCWSTDTLITYQWCHCNY